MRTTLLVLSIAALVGCDKADSNVEPQDAPNSSSTVLAQPTPTDQPTTPPSSDPTRANIDEVVGAWALDRDAMIDRILEEARANGTLPADADRDHPDAIPLIQGLDEMQADIVIRADGTWEGVTAQAGGEPTQIRGTWRATANGYEFTQTAADGVQVPAVVRTASLDDDTLTWHESSMTIYILQPA